MFTLRRTKTDVGRRPARKLSATAPHKTDRNDSRMLTLRRSKSEDFQATNVLRQPSRNLAVIALSETDGNYYKGYITRAVQPPLGTHNVVVILQGRTTTIPAKEIFFYGGASPWPPLKVGDRALVEDGREKYVPARILRIPLGLSYEDTNYSVKLENGRQKSVRRRDIVRIGQGKFEEITIENDKRKQRKKVIRYNEGSTVCSTEDGAKPPTRQTSQEKSPESQIILDDKRIHSADNSPPATPTVDETPPITPTADETPPTTPLAVVETPPTTPLAVDETPKTTPSAVEDTPPTTTPVPSSDDDEISPVTKTDEETKQLKPVNVPPEPKKDPLPRNPGTEVLARWSDDGWYYFGEIDRQTADTYTVMDSTGYIEEIPKKNTVDLANDARENIQSGDHVVALHTKYVFSYAPAVVLDVLDNAGFKVEFYDGLRETLPRSDMYKIPEDEYNETVKYIEKQKRGLGGCQLLARDDMTGLYHLCKVSHPTYNTPHEVVLQMPYQTQTRQSVIHVFPRQPPAQIKNRFWRYVIGPLDPDCQSYLPAEITCLQPLELTFCDGEKTDEVTLDQCIYISKDYYKNAANYYRDASLKREPLED